MIAPPLSLYVHLPWCVRKCPYCDFNSHTASDNTPRQRYIDALLMDLAGEAKRSAGRTVESVFLGGGTPSLFSPAEIAALLAGIHTTLNVAEHAEISMEANPGTVECGDPAGYRDAGVNRLSIGGQSLDDEQLKRLGRIHSSDDIARAVVDARAAGFGNINIDLMYGLPGQTTAAAVKDLSAAIELDPTHISWYQLTLEPNTVFYARPPADLPDTDTASDIQDEGQALLNEAGFQQYEVSAFARDGMSCLHNLNYWLFGDYLAVGAGAHGKISAANGVFRYQKPANPLQYMHAIEAHEAVEPNPVHKADLGFEFMLNALRLTNGFREDVFCERTGQSLKDLQALMRPALEKGLVLRDTDSTWRPTDLGWRFLNDLQTGFLPATAG